MGRPGRTWGRWSVRRWRRHRDEAHALVRESESYLGGRLAVELHSGGQPVPNWAWAAALAHAPAELVASWAADRESPEAARGTLDRWRLALSLMARELMATAASVDVGLEEVQRAALLPLEQRSADQARVEGPDQFIRLGLRALRTYRQSVSQERARTEHLSRTRPAAHRRDVA